MFLIAAATVFGQNVPVISSDDLTALEEKIGRDVVVEGVIQRVGKGPDNGIVF